MLLHSLFWSNMYDTIIIGGGASGLTSACILKGKTLIIESQDRVGKKILATGNGRCNLSNQKMSGEYYSNPEFFKSVCEKLPKPVLDIWKELGLFTHADGAGRIYPFSNQASTVLDLLRKGAEQNADIVLSCSVKDLKKTSQGFVVTTDKGEYKSRNLVLACGGGKGSLAKKMGLEITDTYPALCAIKTSVEKLKGLDGVRMHAKVSLWSKGRELYVESGEVLFRKYGVSGIAVFNSSSLYARALKQSDKSEFILKLDLLDGVDIESVREELDKRIAKGVEKDELLLGIIPVKVANAVLKNKDQKTADQIIRELSCVELGCEGLFGENAQITVGGVALGQIKPTLEAKSVDRLYVLGECLDMDGLCGGYNLHWAFTTGIVCACDINGK